MLALHRMMQQRLCPQSGQLCKPLLNSPITCLLCHCSAVGAVRSLAYQAFLLLRKMRRSAEMAAARRLKQLLEDTSSGGSAALRLLGPAWADHRLPRLHRCQARPWFPEWTAARLTQVCAAAGSHPNTHSSPCHPPCRLHPPAGLCRRRCGAAAGCDPQILCTGVLMAVGWEPGRSARSKQVPASASGHVQP